MKKIIYFVPLFAIAVILLALLVFGLFHQQSPDTEFKTVDITHFDLYDNASGSMVQGAMFAGVSEVTHQVVITAHLWISSKDFGGVEFGIPQGWIVTEKYSSYPDGDINAHPEYSISEWHTGSSVEYNRLVKITPDLNFSSLGEGNEGYVVLVLQPEDGAHPTEECRILVSIGSEMVNGTSVIHPTFTNYSLNFSISR